MSYTMIIRKCVCSYPDVHLGVTIRLLGRTATAESHDNGSESKASLHTVLPDAF